ncbi:hypothetical protein LH402_10105 [Fusobacterium nucleatum]
MKKNKIEVTYDIYFYNIYSEIMKELAERKKSNIFQNLTDTQVEYLEKIKFYFFKTGFSAAVNEVEIKKEFEKLLKEVKINNFFYYICMV